MNVGVILGLHILLGNFLKLIFSTFYWGYNFLGAMDGSDAQIIDPDNTPKPTALKINKFYTVKTATLKENIFETQWLRLQNAHQRLNFTVIFKDGKLMQNRKAVHVNGSLQFPYYGTTITSLFITSGGFLNTGKINHPWLTAVQYIAPLMANFDLTKPNSSIIAMQNDNTLIVRWMNLYISVNDATLAISNLGPFSFQCEIDVSGTIKFLYRKIPDSFENFSNSNYNVKRIGISDGYVRQREPRIWQQNTRRTIYEYDRIQIAKSIIHNFTIITFSPKPTCIEMTTCGQCVNSKCIWCPFHGSTGICSDHQALHRRHQEWEELCLLRAINHCPPAEPETKTTTKLVAKSPKRKQVQPLVTVVSTSVPVGVSKAITPNYTKLSNNRKELDETLKKYTIFTDYLATAFGKLFKFIAAVKENVLDYSSRF